MHAAAAALLALSELVTTAEIEAKQIELANDLTDELTAAGI